MGLYEEVMRSRGFIPKEPVAASAAGSVAGRPHALGWKDGKRVAVPLPNPAWPGYDAAMQRFDRWRSYGSPLGGISAAPWGQAPRFGDDALRPEFRRSTRKWG
jgi:hypothetical protein